MNYLIDENADAQETQRSKHFAGKGHIWGDCLPSRGLCFHSRTCCDSLWDQWRPIWERLKNYCYGHVIMFVFSISDVVLSSTVLSSLQCMRTFTTSFCICAILFRYCTCTGFVLVFIYLCMLVFVCWTWSSRAFCFLFFFFLKLSNRALIK